VTRISTHTSVSCDPAVDRSLDMTSSEILSGLILVSLFTVMCSGQTSLELSSEDSQLSQHETENELVSILEMYYLLTYVAN